MCVNTNTLYAKKSPLNMDVSQKLENRTVKDIFDFVESNSQYIFIYGSDVLTLLDAEVSIDTSGMGMVDIIREVASRAKLEYSINERQVNLYAKAPQQAVAKAKTILAKGQILDDQGMSVPGANVIVKGNPSIGTITDLNGLFSLEVPEGSTIVVSFIGFKPFEYKAQHQILKIVELLPDTELLDEVVITAYGTGQKKASVVGSIQTVRPQELQMPSSNLSNSFAGKLAGVVSYQRTGMPGDNSSDFFIRGISTISGATSPLIVIDGVEASKADLDALDPEIIDGFSILKDATATAMYGTRGANGVMIVTTKSGVDTEKPFIGSRVETYITTPTKLPKFVNGPSYMRLYNEAVTSQGSGDVLFTDEQIRSTELGLNPYLFPNVNWYDEIFRDVAFNQKANFNIRGGSKRITYFMNVSMNHETGMLKNNSKDYYSYNNSINVYKYTFQNNIDFKMSKSSSIALNLSALIDDIRYPGTGMGSIYSSIMNTNPVNFPIEFPNEGEKWVKWGSKAGGNYTGEANPMHNATNGYEDRFASTVRANLTFRQKLDFLTKGLEFKAIASFKNWSRTDTKRTQGANFYHVTDYNKAPDGTYTYEVSPLGTPSKPILNTNRSTYGDRQIYFESSLNYNRNFDKHDVGGLLIYSMKEIAQNTGNGLLASLPQRKISVAGRANYAYDNKYLFEFNAGYNGTENFAKGKRFGFFPAVAVGWNISQEKFWKSIKHVVSNLKLKASYGLVGNDRIGGERFIYLADVTLVNDKLNYQTGYGDNKQSFNGVTYNRFANPDISWEIGEKLNIGFDLTLFNGLDISLDVFKETRKDIFQEMKSIPNYLGTAQTKIFGNLAKVENKGIDMSYSYNKDISKDLSISFRGTFTYSKNKVLEYNEAPGTRPANSIIGHSINLHYGYVTNGLYIDEADIANNPTSTLGNIRVSPGDIKYVDQPDIDGVYDGRIDGNDRVALGYPTVPQITYGFGPSLIYKNWDFSFFFTGAARTSLMMSGFHPFGSQIDRNVLQFIADDYWSPTNQNVNAKYPRLTKYDNNHNTQGSDFWLRNGRYLKLKELEVGCKINKMFRVYVSGSNLLTFSPFKHWDPEMGGGAGLKYPTQRIFNLGVQMTFK